MQLICDGVETKADVVQFSIEQYKEVFVKARREMEKVIEVSSFGTGRRFCASKGNHKLTYAIWTSCADCEPVYEQQ